MRGYATVSWPIDADTFRRLILHEAQVHAVPGRTLRDLGDGVLLHDPADPEPFWNRLAGVRWPRDPAGFDRRLGEVAVLFASVGRQPHLWLGPPHDEPADLFERLRANGFEDMGRGLLMVARDASAGRQMLAGAPPPDVTVEVLRTLDGPAATTAADAIVSVLLDAFEVEGARRVGVIAETLASLGDPRFTHYLIRHDGRPAAVARRATFDGISYLSSIGTAGWARSRGLGRLVTATATRDSVDAGSELIHLGVFADNAGAIRLYESLGFAMGSAPGPDMLLVG
jgi:ribosomal protein S18 acetylase RimI-like enzyme